MVCERLREPAAAGAYNALKKAGFTKVFNLRGGMMEWQKAGQPVSRKRK